MNYNTFLLRFGFNPADFKNKEATIVEGDDDSIIYELEQEIHDRTCPNCFNPKTQVKDHDWVEIALNTTIGKREYLRIRKTRFKCPKCKTTFTPSIQGIERYEKISDITKQSIIQEFYKIQSFKDIADRYGVSVQTVIDLFDEFVLQSLPKHMKLMSHKNDALPSKRRFFHFYYQMYKHTGFFLLELIHPF